jgi:diguanylate cyclase (GGDEF)-like protein
VRGATVIAGWLAAPLLWAAAAAAFALGAAVPPPPAIVLSNEIHSAGLDSHARWWIDETRRATVDNLEASAESIPWRLREPGSSYRLDGKALWFQFDAANHSDQRWFVELGASGVDRAQFFWRRADGSLVSQEAGDTRPVSEWPVPGRLPTFELAAPGEKPVRYWIRIEHERIDYASPLVLYDQGALLTSRSTEQFLLGGYFSLAVLIAIVSFANAIAFRDRNFGVFGAYVLALAAGQAAYLGVGAQHLWDQWLRWNEMASFVLPGVSAAAALWFTRAVTEPQRFSRALDLTVWAVIAALLSAVALDVVLASRQSFLLEVWLATAALAFVAVLIAVVWSQGDDPYMPLIALGFLPLLVTAIFPILRGLNMIGVGPLTRYAVSVGAALEMPILFYALTLRSSRRREAAVRAAALPRNDALTGLAHTRSFLQRLDGALQRCNTLKHACALLVVKVANHDALIAEFGRDAAERALVLAASLLRNVSADMDTVARVGDHHFALLLEGPATPIVASTRAQQLVASGLRSSDALPNGMVLKFQVAVAMLPDRNLDADASLNWLMDAVAAIRPDERKLIRPLNF